MDKIQIKGLRSLTDTGIVELKPINIVVGANSSGKSTFLRSFPLLRQSIEKRTRGPILWNGDLVDFESFRTSVHNSKSSDEIENEVEFKFRFDVNLGKRKFGLINDNVSIAAGITVSQGKRNNVCYTKKYSLSLFKKHEIDFHLNEDGKILKVESNYLKWDLTEATFKSQTVETDSLLPIFEYDNRTFYHSDGMENTASTKLFIMIRESITSISGSSSKSKMEWMASRITSGLLDNDAKLALLLSLSSTKKWSRTVAGWTTKSRVFNRLASLVDFFVVIKNSAIINNELNSVLRGVRYIAPLRTSTERYYRYQDLNIDELDHHGGNLGMFIANISRSWRKKLDEWTLENFDFIIKEKVTTGHISINLEHSDAGVSDNIADMGFGFSQVLPIIVQLWAVSSGYEKNYRKLMSNKILVAIEQPELHLHPKMQGLLAVIFTKAIGLAEENKIDLKLIVETHSPSLLSKFGDLIAMEELDENDISVALFEQDRKTRSSSISYSSYSDEGELLQWPTGFFSY